MNPSIIISLLMSLIALNLSAQLTVSLPTIAADPGSTIYVPVKLSGASSSGIPVGGANIQFTYDPAVLTYVGLVNFYSGTPQNQWFFSGATGTVAANWIEPNLGTIAIPDNTTLYEAQFVYNSGSCPLTYTVYEFTDASYNLIPTTPINGFVEPTAQPQNVTFNVDMSRQTISPDGVHLSGSFNGWNPATTPMNAGSNGIYSVTLPIMQGETHTYRFVNGNTVSGLEIVPADCGVPNGTGFFDRSLTIPANDTILDTVCFSMCTQCPVDIEVTFNVDMSEQLVSPSGVFLSGTFNNWSTVATPMSAGAGNVYSVTLSMQPGQFHLYRFVNGNTSSGYESVPSACGSPSAIGGYDRYLSIPLSDTILDKVCFSSCIECGGTSEYVDVTFSVDLRNEEISSAGVFIAGSFQGWQPGITPMTSNGDSTYSFTQSFLAGTSIQYRFMNGNTSNDYEIVPAACSVDGNREITISVADTTLQLVCFSSCDSCTIIPEVLVTFSVDMSETAVSPEGVHLSGSFQEWDPSANEMALVNNGVYAVTLSVPANTMLEYRFINGNSWSGAEVVPGDCSQNGNRIITVESDSILNEPCFSKCTSCWVGTQEPRGLQSFELSQNYPNPADEETLIAYVIPRSGTVMLQVCHSSGQIVYTGSEKVLDSGRYQEVLSIGAFAPGIYQYRLIYRSDKTTQTLSKLMIVR
jgi:hypothetical protein